MAQDINDKTRIRPKVAVLGAGTMGAGIAGVFAAQGYTVAVYSRSAETLDKARSRIVAIGGEAAVEYTTSIEDCVAGAGIVSENLAEDVTLKQRIFGEIEATAPVDCLLTTNTSSVPITLIAAGLARPERVVGIHWFNPPAVMPLVEIVRGEKTSDEVVQRARVLCADIGKEVIEVKTDIAGFVVNRLQYAILREALHLVEVGAASIEDVDRAVETTLAPRWSAAGPLRLMDLAGLDTVEKVSRILMPALDRSEGIPSLVSRLCEEGAFGTKSGRGFYDWTAEEIAAAIARRDDTVRLLTERRKP
ncbi:3-hydroxyacyl-CoA dehydrogenase family protein [Agrobacterium sp. SHOUNA12C]|uniref:3-hydroxyacyl-CoA dehydrogenase n=1 Tax=Rhizobium rhizogenes NBRC 13257 TaxID=1220581 RepID=A0AA87QE26_RHIRH|nr:3-hydroxyacyl-CoA dehydrogenase family protein [Rhizobium rhizogenes]MCJ9720522.1 3-hydroxyacyl-CoA dehydrogenase family protein [Agrobacterium sp. BETTINA12B]MCJ9760511.1 3-hydroxyacyl-CoA dehydrogenase family protein [Agrobacterium sp. SHOUNA12C]NTF58085.1 3-hydroxyacyl-CoA dehydrogenase family protein [Rhizobium rhizogenes]NTF64504.1 3-hydroxyacyl-CoA dehydrogenase family protein [Rhizobium rhizogenes]NTF77667.1 3-hydroxyacyl-CoA dehydrogenase family protein [Rhizobium rhizogenes]